jgi:hypothetical protein
MFPAGIEPKLNPHSIETCHNTKGFPWCLWYLFVFGFLRWFGLNDFKGISPTALSEKIGL